VKKNTDETHKSALVIASPDFYEGIDGAAVAALEGAAKEGEVISDILRKDGFDVKLFTGLDAQKDVLKKMSSPTILHIATHGTFQEDEHVNSNNMFQSEFLQDPLFQSKLLFARAGDYLENKKTMLGNPLLSAHEVMDLPLEGTKTVVLSACETGLGTSTVGEGVFGMKRAFLVAGAESIFTSLFKVSDNVTLELMQKYYDYYATQNFTKEKAFYEAQRDIMKKYPEPLYWGSFVLTGNK
jgi:CHAT domain-containing protein